MDSIIFQAPAIAKKNGMKSMSDGGFDLTFSTQELAPPEIAAFAYVKGKFGALAFIVDDEGRFSEQDLANVVIPDSRPDFKGDKTPSQKLRAVIYVLWNERGQPEGNFELFYAAQMERIINRFKQELP